MKAPLWLWLAIHRRHGTGPMKRLREGVRALDNHGNATGPAVRVVWYRCECGAVRTISREQVA